MPSVARASDIAPGRPKGVLAALLCVAALLFASTDRAEEVSVPVAIQAELLVKVAAYDRNLPARVGDRVLVLIVTKSGDADSARVASGMATELGSKALIAGLAHEESVAPFTDAASVAATCKGRHVGIAYFTPGFSDDEIVSIARALDGADVLTAAALPAFVPKGIVLGFDLVSGKPKLLVHLGQARRQHADLAADVLKLMRVYE